MNRAQLRRVVAVPAATLLGAGTAYLATTSTTTTSASQPTASSSSPAASSTPLADGPPAAPSSVTAEPRAPTRIAVARLGIDMAVTAEGVDPEGRMSLPGDPAVAGWYRFGAAPGSASGAVVVAAHVDSRIHGVGPFARLSAIRAGDEVLVSTGTVDWRYRVAQVDREAKTAVDLPRIFARDGRPRLHLVTCTGSYDRQDGYAANLVVLADPA